MAAAALGKKSVPLVSSSTAGEFASICRDQIEAAIEAGGEPVQASWLGGLIPTTMLPVLRGKILRPETVHASELIIAFGKTTVAGQDANGPMFRLRQHNPDEPVRHLATASAEAVAVGKSKVRPHLPHPCAGISS